MRTSAFKATLRLTKLKKIIIIKCKNIQLPCPENFLKNYTTLNRLASCADSLQYSVIAGTVQFAPCFSTSYSFVVIQCK